MRKLVFGAIIGLALAAPAQAERFSNAVTGISIDKPAAWHVLTAEANAKNLATAEIGTPEFQDFVRKHASVPLFAFTRYPEPFADVNPSVKLNTRPAGTFAGQAGEQVLRALLPMLQNAMADVKVIKAPGATVLGGKAAGHMQLEYTLRAGGAAYPAVSEMWVVPRGDYLVIVGAGYRPDPKAGDSAEVAKVVQSLQFAN